MNPNYNIKKITDYSEVDRAWAASTLTDVIDNCLLNIKLKQTGVFNKYLFEMSDLEIINYTAFISSLVHTAKQ